MQPEIATKHFSLRLHPAEISSRESYPHSQKRPQELTSQVS